MVKMMHNSSAFYGFERPASAVIMVSIPQARISKGLVFRKAQVMLTKFRLAGQFNRTLSNSGFFSSIDAALPAILESRSLCGAAGKKTALGRSEARSPEKDIQTWVIPSNTRKATTAAFKAITVNRCKLILSNERWGGGFSQPIANKQGSLVKVSVTTVCGK